MISYTFTDKLTGKASRLSSSKSANFTVSPAFGFNSDIDTGFSGVQGTLGISRFPGAKYFYGNVPAAPPAVPAGTVMPIFCLKPTLPIGSPGVANLGNFFRQMRPGQMATIYQEAEHDGYTEAQIKAAHATASTVFDQNAPKGCRYVQCLMTWDASGKSAHGPLNQWVATRADGSPLDMYGFDTYPNTATSPAGSVLDAALAELKLVVPSPVIGITECNYTTDLTGGITYTAGTQAQWFKDAWSWASAHNCLTFISYFLTAHGVPWPPVSATLTELSAIAKASGL